MGSLIFVVSCYFATFLSLFPLPWTIRVKNIPISCLCLWLAQGCLFAGIRAQMWSDNITVQHKIFCDISKRFLAFIVRALEHLPLLYGNSSTGTSKLAHFGCSDQSIVHCLSPGVRLRSAISKTTGKSLCEAQNDFRGRDVHLFAPRIRVPL